MSPNINYQQLFDITGVIFIAIDEKGIVTLANKKACEILEYEEHEIIGKNWFENFIPDSLKKDFIPVSKKILSGELEYVEHYENPVLNKSGKEKIISWHNTIIKDKNGKIIGYLSSGTDITEKIKKDNKLKELTSIVSRSKSIAFVWKNQENWPVEYVSENIYMILGYSANDFISGKIAYSQIVHPDDIGQVSQEVEKKSKSNIQSFTHKPYRVICKNGEEKWISDETYIRRNSEGEITHYEGIVHDITQAREIKELKKAKEKLEQSEEKSRTVADFTYDWEYWVDNSGNFVYVSPSSERITGYKPKDFYNNKNLLDDIIHPDDKLIFQNHKHELTKKGKRDFVEFRVITKNNKTEWIGHQCLDVYDKSGIKQGIRGSNRKITEQVEIKNTFKDNEELFRAITTHAQDAIILTDTNDKIKFWNKAAEKIFGYTSNEVIGKELHPLILPEKYMEQFKKGYAHFKKTGQGNAINKTLELSGLRKNKDVFSAELSLTTLTIKDELHSIGIVRDISDRKAIELANKKLLTAVTQSPAAILITNPEGDIEFVNPYFTKITGYSYDEAINKNPRGSGG